MNIKPKTRAMNNTLTQFARNNLKEGLKQCTEAQVHMFKRMYSHNNLELPINEVVDNMPAEKLDRAMEQVEATLAKRKGDDK